MTNTQLIEDLRATREALATRGRCTTALVKTCGEVCLDGAVGVATIKGFTDLEEDAAYTVLKKDKRSRAVTRALAAHVMDTRLSKLTSPYRETIAEYIDRHYGCVVAGVSEGRDARAVWIFNDWCDKTDQDCFDLIDKAIANEGGMA